MVISWLINAVIKDIGQSILLSSTASDAWLRLERRFGEVDSTKIFRVQRDLCLISQNNMSVADYFTQIKKLWEEYNGMITIPCCICGLECASLVAAHKLIKDQQLIQFLVGLNEDYKIARGNILTMKSLPDIDQAYNLILHEEKQRLLTAMSQFTSGSSAFNANFLNQSKHYAFATQQKSYNLGFQQRGSHISEYKSGQHQGFLDHYFNSTHKTTRFGNKDRRQQLYCDH